MAVKKIGVESTDEKLGAATGGSSKKSASAPDVNKFLSLVDSFNTGSGLSKEGSEYVEQLRSMLEDPSRDISIKMQLLPVPSGTVMFMTNKVAVIVMFSECAEIAQDQNQNQQLPKSLIQINAVKSFRSRYDDDYRILTVVLIDPSSYSRVKEMASYIAGVLKAAVDDDVMSFTLADMESQQFSIDPDINNVRAFVNAHSPHATPARADIGFTINVRRKNALTLHQNRYDQSMDMYTPIMAVTAFVDLVANPANMGGNTRPFTPIIRVTDIVSVIPSSKIMPLALTTAADIFIAKGIWKSAFSSFSKDAPNLGNLHRGPDGELFNITNVQDRESFMSMWLDRPALAIDITDGRACIPGIQRYSNPANYAEIIQEYAEFLGTQLPMDTVPCNPAFTEFAGTIQTGSEIKDSRTVDYLTMVKNFSGPGNERIGEFLNRYPDPKFRADMIRNYFPNFTRLYLNRVIAFNSSLLSQMANIIGSRINLQTSVNSMNGIDLSYIQSQAQNFGAGMPSLVTQGQGYTDNFMSMNTQWF